MTHSHHDPNHDIPALLVQVVQSEQFVCEAVGVASLLTVPFMGNRSMMVRCLAKSDCFLMVCSILLRHSTWLLPPISGSFEEEAKYCLPYYLK